jgi:shikimate dehydrogenase
MTRPYAEVIGDPIAHSKSPLIHNFWLEKLGIDAEYRATRVTPDTLNTYLAKRRRDPAWRGCNVTMPLKQAAMNHADRSSADVQDVNAANILFPAEAGGLIAENSDIVGVADPLRAMARVDYPNHVATYVQIIGAGGAARAAGLGAIEAGYGDFDIFNRNPGQGDILAELVGAPFGKGHSLDALGPIRNPGDGIDNKRYSIVLINATPMGMSGQPEVPVDLSAYYPDTIVFEMIYNPLETGLVRQARQFGLRVIDGLQMLVAQAAPAFEKFFGQPAPRQHDAELRERLIA